MAPHKLKIALISLTSCEGCYCELLGLRERFLALQDRVDFVEFRLVEDDHHFETENLDVVFIEGSPITQANIETLKRLRDVSKTLIACGACAHIGGIYHMKNYSDAEKTLKYVYAETTGIESETVKPISAYVTVDYALPTCPINREEMLRFIYSLVIGKGPQIHQNPVCYECASRGYECLLQKGEICLGPITQGGCGAICLKSKQTCFGCRGLLKKPQVKNWLNLLKGRGVTQREINKILQVYGVKELVPQKLIDESK
jgi:coenzyme F420-reducing hydrogenase gamma subunit